jgi:integrase
VGYIYKRGKKLWMGFAGPGGKPEQKPTGYEVGQEAEAQALLDAVEAQVAAGFEPDGGPVTVKGYAAKWIEKRRKEGVVCVDDDEQRINAYLLPKLGKHHVADVRPRDAHAWASWLQHEVKSKRTKKKLAPRTVLHIVGIVHAMFESARIDELVTANPIAFRRGDLPKKRDADPRWRALSVFTRDEVETIISAAEDKVPWDRRVLYALWFLGGFREGESSALRWRVYDDTLSPLGRIEVFESYNTKLKRTSSDKTETPRMVPVHPVLAAILAEWKLTGWRRYSKNARAPQPDDLIVPSRLGRNRTGNMMRKRFYEDLERLGLRKRHPHACRRTMISLCRADGARQDLLTWITHGPPDSVQDDYTTFPWATLCAEILKLNIRRRTGDVIALPRAASASVDLHPTYSEEKSEMRRESSWSGQRDSNSRPGHLTPVTSANIANPTPDKSKGYDERSGTASANETKNGSASRQFVSAVSSEPGRELASMDAVAGLLAGFSAIDFDAFAEVTIRELGATRDYAEGAWPLFQAGPIAYCLSRTPRSYGEALWALAVAKVGGAS